MRMGHGSGSIPDVVDMNQLISFPETLRISGVKYLLPILLCVLCQAAAAAPYIIEVSKSERILAVKQNEKTIKEYNISHGRGGKGTKIRAGDNKTPTGTYRAIDFKTNSKFHFFIQLNYPNPLDAWRGYTNEVISATEFKRIVQAYKRNSVPPQNTGLGGYIGIHGIGWTTDEKNRIHEAHNWTEGCIAVRNEEINELRKYITLGTKVVIRE